MVTYKSTGAAGKIYRSTAEKKYLPAKMMYGENMASGYDAQTETGTEIALLPDYNDGMTKLRINGKTEQRKNLLPYPYSHTTRTVNGITFTDNGDGNVTVNGTATANATWYFYLNTKSLIGGLKIGDTITVSIFYDKTWTSSSVMSVVFNYYDAAATMKSGNCILYPDYSYKTITIGDDWVGIGFYIVVLKGQTVDNITLKAQVELGSSATEYQPYNPSPDNPLPMTDFTCGEVVCRGKNLLNTYGFSAGSIESPTSNRKLTNSYGTTISTTEPTNSITVTQVYNSDYAADSYKNGYICIGINDEVVFEKSYRLSFDIDISENPANAEYLSLYSNGTSGGGSSARIPLGGTRVSSDIFNFTKNSSVPTRRYIEIRCMGMSFTISNIMITEAGVEDIEYEPYITPIIAQIQDTLRQVGDVYDYIEVSNGAVKKYQNIGTATENVTDAKPNSAYLGTMTKNGTADEGGTITVKDGETVYYILSIPIVTDITDTETGQSLLGMNTEYGKGKVLTITDSSMTVTQCKMNTCSI